jgi:hypothetical protein
VELFPFCFPLKQFGLNVLCIKKGFVTDEGSVFVPHDLKTGQDFRQYFKLLIESANSSVLAAIEGLYPDPALDSNSPYANSVESPQFKRISAAFTDYAYAMAVKQTAISLASFNVPVWKYHFDFVQNRKPLASRSSVRVDEMMYLISESWTKWR